jgi:hypothetical protein
VRRRQQLKKRRDYRGNNSFMGVNAVAVTTGRRDREANAARVEALPSLTNVMKESTKAARRAMDRGKPPSMPADVEKGDQRKVRRPSRAGGKVLMEPLSWKEVTSGHTSVEGRVSSAACQSSWGSAKYSMQGREGRFDGWIGRLVLLTSTTEVKVASC